MASLARFCRSFASVSIGSSSVSSAVSYRQVIAPRLNSCSFHSIVKSKSLLDSVKRPLLQPTPLQAKSSPDGLNQTGSFVSCRGFLYYSFKEPLTPYLKRYIDRGPPKKKPKKFGPTEGRPFLKGVVLKTMIKKPKKPNSANRKCVRIRLSTGREATAYIPGIGHNLQEHHTVLVRGGRVQDLPGVKLKCVRGKYDLAHVKKVTT